MTSSTSCFHSSREQSVPLSWQAAEVRAVIGLLSLGRKHHLAKSETSQIPAAPKLPPTPRLSLTPTNPSTGRSLFFYYETFRWPVYVAASFQLKYKERAKCISAPLVVVNVGQPC